mmetsp:Transcript_13257/g.36629  ORF Transcript_13257/g.36629 Transcript_13257/m.36629 type:complete len:111 (-) Transcript_13257:8-340(-)
MQSLWQRSACALKTACRELTSARSLSTSAPTWSVYRTPNGQLPVYSEFRNARTRELTIIRKIVGDPNLVRQTIISEFEISPNEVWVKGARVEVKGAHRRALSEWLAKKGF